MKVVLGPCSLVIEDGPSRILLPRLCFGEGYGGGPPSCMLSLGSIILGNGEKTGMGGKGQRKWEEVGGSCNVGMWGCCLRRREDVGTGFKMELGGDYWKC